MSQPLTRLSLMFAAIAVAGVAVGVFTGRVLAGDSEGPPATRSAELPAGTGGALLVILGEETATFELLAIDGAGDLLSISGQGQGANLAYAGFTSDSDITTIVVVSTSGRPIAISSFFFEG